MTMTLMTTVKKTILKTAPGWMLAAAVLLTASTVAAQTPRPTDPELRLARQKISMIEGVLERAVQNGADNLVQKIRQLAPSANGVMLAGTPQVRGFRLERYGVFFDVAVPSLRLSMMLPLRYNVEETAAAAEALDEIQALLDRHVRDAGERAQLQLAVRRLERQVGSRPRGQATRSGTAMVSSLTTGQSVAPPASPVDTGVLDDPTEAYRGEVRRALIDAMLDNMGGITIGPDELVTVAARSSIADTLVPGDPADARTIMLRVKGSDLAAYRAGTITLDDARKRVDVREY